MADNKRIEIVISGDPSGLKRATAEAAEALDKVRAAGEKLAGATKSQSAAADQYLDRLKQEVVQLTQGDLALRRYQLSKMAMTDAQAKSASALLEQIDNLKRYESAAGASQHAQESLTDSVIKGTVVAELITRAFDKVVGAYREMKAATTEAQQVELRTQAVLRATGEAYSGKREIIERVSQAMKELTRFDDDQVKATAQQILTMGLSNDAFERALKLGGDLAITFNKDLSSATLSLAQALQEPGEKIGALDKLLKGAFNDSLKKQIKNLSDMNETAAAQELIFRTLESRVQGVAEGAYRGLERQTEGVRKAWGDMLKAMGSKIFDEKATEAGYLETRLTNITSAINSNMPIWLKAVDVLGSLTVAWVPGMDLKDSAESRKRWESKSGNVSTGTITRADNSAAEKSEAALGLLTEMREKFKTNNDKLADELKRFRKLVADTGMAEAEFADIEKKIRDKYADKAGDRKAETERQRELDRLQKIRMTNLKAEADLWEETDKEQRKAIEATDQMILRLRDGNEAMRTEIEAVGLTRVERELLIVTREKDAALLKAADDYQRGAITALYDEKAALIQLRAAREDNLSVIRRSQQAIGELGERTVDALMRGVQGVKEFAREMAAVFLKKWLLNIGASMTGSSALAAQASQVGGNSLVGTAMNSMAGSSIGNMLGIGTGSIFGGSAAYGAALGTTSIGAGSQAAMLAAQTGEFGLAGLGATGSAAGGAGGTLASSLAAAGPYIAAALAIYAIYKAFAKPRGGAKTGGSYQGIYDSLGGLSGTNATNLFGLKPGESTQDGMVSGIVGNASSAYYQLVKNLGGTAQGYTFGLGYDSDPKGTAPNRIKGQLTDANGNRIFNELDRDIGRDGERIGPELQLTASRMILAAVKASELPDYLAKVLDGVVIETASQSEIDETIKKLSETKAAWDGLKDGVTNAQAAIEALNDNALPSLIQQLESMAAAVEGAETNFDAALAGGDAIAIRAAQDELLAAVVNRYQTEKQMLAEIQASLSSLAADAYEFRMANGERINRYGGSVNLGAIASGRLGDLRGLIDAGGTPAEQMANIQAFLGTVDAWVNAEAGALNANAAGSAAIAQAQAAAINTQIEGLQQQLQLAQAWKGVMEQAEQAIARMQYSAASPLSGLARLGMAGDDVQGLLGQYRGATGAARQELASRLLNAVNTRQGLGEGNLQRPSDDYLALYNQNMAIYTEIKDDAKTEAEKALDIQTRIEDLQRTANALSSAGNAYASAANDQLGAIHAQARELAIWAGEQYETAAAAQEKILLEQRDAITGGMDIALYQAQQATRMTEFLSSIDAKITAFLTGTSNPGTGTTGSGGATPILGGGNIIGGGGTGIVTPGGGAGTGIVPAVEIPINIGGTEFDRLIARVVDNRIEVTSTKTRRAAEFS